MCCKDFKKKLILRFFIALHDIAAEPTNKYNEEGVFIGLLFTKYRCLWQTAGRVTFRYNKQDVQTCSHIRYTLSPEF
jgi:hypothetical protein